MGRAGLDPSMVAPMGAGLVPASSPSRGMDQAEQTDRWPG